jgi:cytochrome c oxidase subunit 1
MNRALIQVTLVTTILVGAWLVYRGPRSHQKADGGYPAGQRITVDVETFKSQALRWLTTTNHRDIGILYIVLGTVAALWGGMDGMMLRTELLTPAADVWSERTYNALFTTHGLTMLFFFVTPVFFGLGNYFLPLLLGADDMAFPRLNAIGFWLLPPSLLLARAGLFAQVTGQALSLVTDAEFVRFFQSMEEVAVGWTLYTPLSTASANPQLDLLLLGLHLSGIATTIGAINFIVTIVYESADDVNWATLDIFSWNMLTTSGLIVFAFPLLGSVLVMLLLDRNLGTTFFTVEGGSPILWQHLFWFFGHPEVYIIFLPATGLMSTILPKFVGRKLFGFRFIVYSTLGIGVMSFGVWAHHMFVTSMDPRLQASFMAVSIAIAVPSAIKVFNWLTTMWNGNIRVTAPLILCVSSIGLFVVGGVTGVFLAAVPVDVVYHGTYYVVGHFHLILMGIIPMMMFAASYYWYPILTGRMYDRKLAMFQSGLLLFGVALTFGMLLVLGLAELPRRYANYPAMYAPFQQAATIGAYLIGLSVLLWLYNLLWSARTGQPVQDGDPWDLKETDQFTKEWQWFERRLEDRYDIETPEPDETRPSSTTEVDRGSPAVVTQFSDTVGLFLEDAALGVVSGLVGLALMGPVLAAAIVIGFLDLAAFSELAELVGISASPLVGVGAFILGGVLTWPLLYAALSTFLPGQYRFVSGIWFTSVTAPGFIVAFYTGQTGLVLVGYLVFVMVAHWAYGFGLGFTFGYLSSRWDIVR